MTPAHRTELERIAARPMGLPAARALANAMLRQRVQPRDQRGRYAKPTPASVPSKAEQVWSCIGIAFIVIATPFLVAGAQALEWI